MYYMITLKGYRIYSCLLSTLCKTYYECNIVRVQLLSMM